MSDTNVVGLRVVRGADWKWGNQDGGEGGVGTVVQLQSSDVAIVLWDSGQKGNYARNGLRVLDNRITGVRHDRVYCDECPRTGQCISGFRWKCQQCPDYDLCNDCYFADKHNTSHSFIRYDTDGCEGGRIPARRSARRIQAKGLYVGASVRRGPNWNASYGDQDGGGGKLGTIASIGDAIDETSLRSYVKVRWSAGRPNDYRRGFSGCVDVQCVTPGNGEMYYPEHLAKLGDYGRSSADSGGNITNASDSTVELVRQLASMLQGTVVQQPIVAVSAPSTAAAATQLTSGLNYNFRVASYVEVMQQNGFVCYAGPERSLPVALLVAQHPFDDSCSYFELEIVNTGQIGAIAIGVVPDGYPLDNQPGWKAGSIGYHADDGGIFRETGSAPEHKALCKTGDRMGCGVELKRRKPTVVYFTKNGQRIFQTAFGDSSVELFPAVGMHSRDEMVKLLDPRPWRP